MADNEKLDNQRLKNFKNKGRDLEVGTPFGGGGGSGAAPPIAPKRVPAGLEVGGRLPVAFLLVSHVSGQGAGWPACLKCLEARPEPPPGREEGGEGEGGWGSLCFPREGRVDTQHPGLGRAAA